MRIAFVSGFAWEPKGTARARAFPLAVELVNRGHEVAIFVTPYDNPSESGQKRQLEGVRSAPGAHLLERPFTGEASAAGESPVPVSGRSNARARRGSANPVHREENGEWVKRLALSMIGYGLR